MRLPFLLKNSIYDFIEEFNLRLSFLLKNSIDFLWSINVGFFFSNLISTLKSIVNVGRRTVFSFFFVCRTNSFLCLGSENPSKPTDKVHNIHRIYTDKSPWISESTAIISNNSKTNSKYQQFSAMTGQYQLISGIISINGTFSTF